MKGTEVEQLMSVLSTRPKTPLRFYLEGVSINQGYHVTEVKYASIRSMDCGRRTDSWDELLIQLLDGNANSEKGYMSSAKFMGIVNTSLKSLPESSTPDLFFEFTPNNGSLKKLKIQTIDYNDNELSVHLTSVTAACKPFQRWVDAFDDVSSKVTNNGCCTSGSASCG